MAFLRSSKERELDQLLSAELDAIEDQFEAEMHAKDNQTWRELDEIEARKCRAEIEAYNRHNERLEDWRALLDAEAEGE